MGMAGIREGAQALPLTEKKGAKIMEKTYTINVQGTPETAERAVRLLDRVFRSRYNVHGIRRMASAFDRATKTLSITVNMTADWMDSPRMRNLFPEYQPSGIKRTWYTMMAKESALDDTYIREIEEGE